MRAPEDQLKAALAAVERKKQQALVQGEYEEQLKALTLPEAFRGKALQLLFKPDKNSLEYKAMDAACTALGMTPMRLMVAVGGVESPRALHEAKFLADCFPKGTGFPTSMCRSRPPICPWPMCRRSRSTTSRRPKSTMRCP
jgi:exoribonuclease-2